MYHWKNTEVKKSTRVDKIWIWLQKTKDINVTQKIPKNYVKKGENAKGGSVNWSVSIKKIL